NRILEIDELNLLAVVEPNVINADLQRAVEKVGLFYPPDPASLDKSSIGGNVAECAGGPRAFKYGTTKRYVLALEAVLPTGEVIETGSKAVKNVVGYDLTQLLVGSEGTLAIITRVTLRLLPKPPANATLLATFGGIRAAAEPVAALMRRRAVPRGRVPELFDVIAEVKRRYSLRVASFGHAGDGNIHVNLLLTPGNAEEAARAKEAERFLFRQVVELEGSISGEHGIGFAKAPYL